MTKELIEQLAKEYANQFKFSVLGRDLHTKINCGDISANALMEIVYRKGFAKAYQSQSEQQEHCCPECGCHFVGEFPFEYHTKQAIPDGWKSLSDVQWMNIVNNNFAWATFDKETAIHEVVKLVEAKLRELNTAPTNTENDND